MPDCEAIAVMILFHLGNFLDLKHFYLFYVQQHLIGDFPYTLSYNRFVDLSHRVCMPLDALFKNVLSWSTYRYFICRPYFFLLGPARTNVSTEIKYSKILLILGNILWVGFTVSSCTWLSITKERFLILLSHRLMLMIGSL